jgi:sugar lactone lactonase YvrE
MTPLVLVDRRRVMGRSLRVVAAAVVTVVAMAAGATAATTAGGGTQRWTSSYLQGEPAYSTDVLTSTDGSTVFTTGTTEFGPDGRAATLAYDAATGERRWVATYSGGGGEESSRGRALALSPDGDTLFVTGWTWCDRCTTPFYGLLTIAYDAATGERRWVARFADADSATGLVVSPDGSRVFVTGQTDGGDTSVTVAYGAMTGNERWVVRHEGGPTQSGGGLAVSPDGATLYVAGTLPDTMQCPSSGGYRTSAYATADGAVRWTSTFNVAASVYCGEATSLRLSPDGSTVFVTGFGGGSSLHDAGTVAYDSADGDQRWATVDRDVRVKSGDIVVSLGVSPDGSTVYILGNDCSDQDCPFATAAYDSSTGGDLWVSRYEAGGRGYAADLVVSPDGAQVLVTGQVSVPCYPCVFSETHAPLVSYDAVSGDVRWASVYPDSTGSALAVSPDSSSVYLAGTITASTATARARAASASCTSGTCGIATARYNTGPGPGRLQDADAAPRYDGWRSSYENTAAGATYRASRVPGDSVAFRTPRADSVVWLTHQGPDQGRARVLIDGRRRGVFDLYAPEPSARAISFDGLPEGSHTLKVKVLGSKRAASAGTWVAVDGFEYGIRRRDGVAQETSTAVRYNGWAGRSSAAASGGSYRWSRARGAATSVDFRGRSITWLTATGPGYGRARVVVDGEARVVDLYAARRSWRVPVTFRGLSRGQHRITVRALGRKHRLSGSTAVVFDAFVVRS